MQLSSNLAGCGRKARLVIVTVAAVAVGGLAGCGGGDESAALIRATVKVQSITQQGQCEDVNIKVTPVQILPGAPKLSNDREFVTPVKLTKGADNVSCTGSSQTIPMAPGKWKFTANLPSEIASCERDIAATGNRDVGFKDGDTTCS
ncbi:MAG TPA: hypothetical protein VMU00_02290 [Steroidobacteraceae bacterium]|nr:hypothetical protein [Steroidobacteraceae bacterium]